MSALAIETRGLRKRYRGTAEGLPDALSALDLAVPRGTVLGFLGPNGAGKTTTIRLLLDLIRPTAGSARLLGEEVRAAGPDLRRKIGYLAGDFAIGDGETVRHTLDFLAQLRGGVERARIDALCDRLGLDVKKPVRALSKGNRQKIGLVQAFMHNPELLILDEPTSGLDPLVQHTFLDLVTEARQNGQTVFMSSHVLSEVQHAADRVVIVRGGKVVEDAAVEDLDLAHHARIRVVFAAPPPADAFADVVGLEDTKVEGDTLEATLVGDADALIKSIARFEVKSLRAHEPDLEEIFMRHYTGDDEAGA